MFVSLWPKVSGELAGQDKALDVLLGNVKQQLVAAILAMATLRRGVPRLCRTFVMRGS